MNKFSWTYIDDRGGRHQIGLMHGPKSGNLLILSNSNILLIDFKVFNTSSYSFFIEEELCEIDIERKDDNFLYGFQVNKKVDTPLNRRRKQQSKKHLYQSLAFLGTVLLIVVGTTFFLTNFHKQKKQEQFQVMAAKYHEKTEARVIVKTKDQDSYSFIVNGQTYQGKTKFRNTSPSLPLHGMPIEDGDEFMVKYLSKDPSVSEIDYNSPSKDQTEKYIDKVTKKHLELNPKLDPAYCSCFTQTVYEFDGLRALADVYFQNVSSDKNQRNNKDSFKHLVSGQNFNKKLNKNCFKYLNLK